MSISAGGKDLELNFSSNRNNRTPLPSGHAGSDCQRARKRVEDLIALRERILKGI